MTVANLKEYLAELGPEYDEVPIEFAEDFVEVDGHGVRIDRYIEVFMNKPEEDGQPAEVLFCTNSTCEKILDYETRNPDETFSEPIDI